VKLVPGQMRAISFDFPAESRQTEERMASGVETRLTLRVPANAKVYLAGVETRSTGESRFFTTRRLKQGEQWPDYTIKVEVEREGRVVAKQHTLTLSGGDALDLTLDVEDDRLASNND
jgi:uncharacterized protein (TIGR03000 family)